MVRALLLTLIAACSVPGDRFFKPGEGSNDGGTADGATDAPPNLAARRAYVGDLQTGVYFNHKDPNTGALMRDPASPMAVDSSQGAITNQQGTRLFVFEPTNPTTIRDFAIQSDGSLAAMGGMTILNCGAPRYASMHPTGRYIAIGCGLNTFAILTLSSSGAPASVNVVATGGMTMLLPVFTPDGKCLYVGDLNGAANARIAMYSFDANTGVAMSLGNAPGPAVPRGIAVHPSGSRLYLAGTGSPAVVQTYSIDSTNCLINANPNTQPISSNSGQALVDPTGKFLFVIGTEVFAFRIEMDGGLTPVAGSPFITTGMTMDSATIDPAQPNILYITGRGYAGTFPATIASDGSVSMGQIVMTGGTNTYWLTLAP